MTKRTRPRKTRRKKEEWVDYCFQPTAWWVDHSAWKQKQIRGDEWEYHHSIRVKLKVRLRDPVKGVRRGRLEVSSHPDQTRWGDALLSYSTTTETGERLLSGIAWTNEAAVLALVTLLASGREVELRTRGQPFRYRETFTRSFCWFSADHPDRDDM